MNEKSEQIDARLNILTDEDQPLSPKRLDSAVMSALPNATGFKADIGGKKVGCVVYDSGNYGKHVFLTAAVTFLGGHGNHPIFKKRVQLKSWFKSAHSAFTKHGYVVHFLGVYHYCGNIVFVDFAPDTYLKRKMHNSSAFVYVNDLFRAMKDGVAVRTDLHGNVITTIRFDKMKDWLLKSFAKTCDFSDVFKVFDDFNSEMPFNQWLDGKSAITEMRDSSWSKWKETEWAGWYLEFRFSAFLTVNDIKTVVYQGNDSKKAGALDFDLIFPTYKFYGDLKASDIAKHEAPGNDQESLMEAISKFDRFWYVIYEHETVKDKVAGGEVCKFRYEMLQAFDGSGKSPTSYLNKMKNRVNFKRMMILELNRANCGEILSAFNQGHQPDGSARAPKFLISKRNVENFQVFHYEA